MLCCFCIEDTADVELIPDRDDTPDYLVEDTITMTLKRDHSIRRSQRSSRLVEQQTEGNSFSVCVCITGVTCFLFLIYFLCWNFVASD